MFLETFNYTTITLIAGRVLPRLKEDYIMRVEVEYKLSYGNERFYGKNDLAKDLLTFIDRKSYTAEQLRDLRKMGFRVVLHAPESVIERVI